MAALMRSTAFNTAHAREAKGKLFLQNQRKLLLSNKKKKHTFLVAFCDLVGHIDTALQLILSQRFSWRHLTKTKSWGKLGG